MYASRAMIVRGAGRCPTYDTSVRVGEYYGARDGVGVGDLVERACQLQRSPGNRVGVQAEAEAETSRCGVGSCTKDSMNDRGIDELG